MDKQRRYFRIIDMNAMRPYFEFLEKAAEHVLLGKYITILEIGVRDGDSTVYFLRGLKKREQFRPGGELYSIDIKNNTGKQLNQFKDDKRWHFIIEDSKKVVWNKTIDILMIDGDHSYEGVKADWEKYEPFVREGGLILMHDVTNENEGVKDFWKEVKEMKSEKINLPFHRVGLGVVIK